MSCRYSSAVQSVLASIGGDASESDVLRVDPHKGDAVLVQVAQRSGPRWYSFDAGSVRALELAQDKKLPAAKRLDSTLHDSAADLLGWRPGKRATVRANEATILKGYRAGRSQDACNRYRIAEQALVGTCLVAPSVLQHSAEQACIEMSVVPGSPMTLDVTQVDQFFRLGDGLRRFQTATPASGLAHHGRDAELVLMTRLASRVMELRGELPEGWSSAANLLTDKIPSGRPSGLSLTHRDLHDGQLLLGEQRIGLLDFDLLCLADSALDVANLTAHLRLRAIQGLCGATEASVEHLSVALLEGLDRSQEDGFLESLRFYQATSFLRLSLVYFLRPRWQEAVPPLVSLASRCIDEMATA